MGARLFWSSRFCRFLLGIDTPTSTRSTLPMAIVHEADPSSFVSFFALCRHEVFLSPSRNAQTILRINAEQTVPLLRIQSMPRGDSSYGTTNGPPGAIAVCLSRSPLPNRGDLTWTASCFDISR